MAAFSGGDVLAFYSCKGSRSIISCDMEFSRELGKERQYFLLDESGFVLYIYLYLLVYSPVELLPHEPLLEDCIV